MRVVLRDHDYDPEGEMSAWGKAIIKHFSDTQIDTDDSYLADCADTLVVLHTSNFNPGGVLSEWIGKVDAAEGAALLLVGSGGYVGGRDHANPRVYYCDWTPEGFEKAFEEPIQRFIQSVRTNDPDWSALSPCAALSALSILCQGYLAVHAIHLKNAVGTPEADELLRSLSVDVSDAEQAVFRSLGTEENRRTVRQPKWWLGVFDSEDCARAGQALSQSVRFEWPKFEEDDACKKLLDTLISATTEEAAGLESVEEHVVQAAYDAIGRRIQG